MQEIKYNLCERVNIGSKEMPEYKDILYCKILQYSEANLEIAKAEAHNGEYSIVDNGDAEIAKPTQLDRIEAQVTYTAMMTDTLLEV